MNVSELPSISLCVLRYEVRSTTTILLVIKEVLIEVVEPKLQNFHLE